MLITKWLRCHQLVLTINHRLSVCLAFMPDWLCVSPRVAFCGRWGYASLWWFPPLWGSFTASPLVLSVLYYFWVIGHFEWLPFIAVCSVFVTFIADKVINHVCDVFIFAVHAISRVTIYCCVVYAYIYHCR